MTKKVIAGLSASIAIVLHGAQLTDSGERRDGGSTLIVGKDISAARALDLLAAQQISNSEEQAEAGFDLQVALEAAAAEELAAAESAETPELEPRQVGESENLEDGAPNLGVPISQP